MSSFIAENVEFIINIFLKYIYDILLLLVLLLGCNGVLIAGYSVLL